MNALEGRDLGVRLGESTALAGACATVCDGEVTAFLGPNGAGKTTLIRVLAGLLAPENGEVRLGGRHLARWPRSERARLLGYLPQEATVHWPLTVERVVALGRLPHLFPWQGLRDGDQDAVDRALAATETSTYRHRPVTQLSEGERTRVLLARVLASEPRVLLADEPVAGLDPYHQIHFMELVREYAGKGRAVALVLHDLNLAARFCDRLYLLDRGRITAAGPPRAVLAPGYLTQVFGIWAVYGESGGEPYVIPWKRA